jgi:hypothetical protein
MVPISDCFIFFLLKFINKPDHWINLVFSHATHLNHLQVILKEEKVLVFSFVAFLKPAFQFGEFVRG